MRHPSAVADSDLRRYWGSSGDWEATMQCPKCSNVNTTEIHIRLKSEEAVRFHSCRYCEHRWWKYEGEAIALDEVLTITAEKEPAR